MFEPPLFEDNILSTLWRNFEFYLNDGYCGYFYLIIMGLIAAQFLWIRARPVVLVFPNQIYYYTPKDRKYLFFAILSFVVLCVIVYNQKMSLFATYDLMSISTISSFVQGNGATISTVRFAPFANVELNLFYAISHNLYVISALVLMETVIILFLCYRLFDFIPVSRRLTALSLVIFYPALVWVNNPIFPERLMLIFICMSLIVLKKYMANPKTLLLIIFCVLMNLAIYTKETVILFYAGLLSANILYLVYRGKIKPASFLHPFRTAKEFPLEYMMFFSMGIFLLIYLVLGLGIEDNVYVCNHRDEQVWKKYYFEILICSGAFAGLIFSKKKFSLMYGILLGALAILLFLIGKLQIYNGDVAYYVLVSGIMGIFVFYYAVEKQILRIFFMIVFLMLATMQNIVVLDKQNGDAYYDVANYLDKFISNNTEVNVFVKDSLDGKYEEYIVDCYRSVYKYYFPDRIIIFKTNSQALADKHALKFPLIYQSQPEQGDIYIVRKFYQTEIPKNYKLLYENRLFYIFKVKNL